MLGITGPIFLFSVLHVLYGDQFVMSAYPMIRNAGSDARPRGRWGVRADIQERIEQKGAPCSIQELAAHFVDKLGYSFQNVYGVRDGKNFLSYGTGAIVAVSLLDWTPNRMGVLASLADAYLAQRTSAGKPYGLLSDFVEDPLLPEMPACAPWTPTLLGELLCREGTYRLIGLRRNAFVKIPNTQGIETLDDLLYLILNDKYGGAENIDRFVSHMRAAGVLAEHLTPLMLRTESKVVIKGNVVRLAELTE